MLQAPVGGEFEHVPGLRTADHDDDESLGRVLAGLTTIPITLGVLMLFGGRHLLHGVCRVSGSRRRHIATLCYLDRPDMMNSQDVRLLFGGRAQGLLAMSPGEAS